MKTAVSRLLGNCDKIVPDESIILILPAKNSNCAENDCSISIARH